MLKKGLKTNIFLVLFLLLLTGMLLVYVVMAFTWYRSEVATESKNIFSVVQYTIDPKNDVNRSSRIGRELNSICEMVGERCEGWSSILLDQNQGSIGDPVKLNLPVESYHTQKKFIENGYVLEKVKNKPGFYNFIIPFKANETFEELLVLDINFNHISLSVIKSLKIVFVYILINAIVLATVGFFRMVKSIVKPIDRLIKITEGYTTTEDASLMFQGKENEFGKLSLALKSMLNRIGNDKQILRDNIVALENINNQLIESQEMMVRAEKLAAVGRLSAGLAHEIGNPIGIVQGYIELLSDEQTDNEAREQYCERALKELERVNRMVRQLLDYSRKPTSTDEIVSVKAVINDIEELVRAQFIGKNIKFELDISAANDFVKLTYDDLYQTIINCIFNSIDAVQSQIDDKNGEITIKSQVVKEEGDRFNIEISISDNGVGVSDEELKYVFDPFFTTKDIGKGTGLGLSISYAIIETAHGSLTINSEFGEWTKVVISLPIAT